MYEPWVYPLLFGRGVLETAVAGWRITSLRSWAHSQ